MKQCSKCKEWKNEDEFNKDKSKKDGIYPQCKKCREKHREKYREEINQKKREWYRNHREEINQKDRENYWNNKEEKNRKSREYARSPLKYDSQTKYKNEIELYEKTRESKNGNVEIKCAYCDGWFEPTKNQIQNRLNAINGKSSEGSEHRIYCSNKCKENCPVYWQQLYPKDEKPATSREVQPELRKLTFQRDDYTCQRCGNHRDNLEVGIHCHHIDGIQWNPLESADVYNCITLCEDCHNEVHDQKGCRYHELKCNK